MKNHIASTLLILGSIISNSSVAASLDVNNYQFASYATSTSSFGISGANSLNDAMSDESVSSFVYVPSGSTQTTMTMSLGFNSAVTNQTGIDLTFFFVGGGTENALDLTIGSTTRSYNTSSVLYTDDTNQFVYTANTDVGEFALSAIYVDLDSYGISSLTDMDITLGKGAYLALVGGTPATVSEVPLPAAVWLFITGLGALGLISRRRR